MMLKWLRRIFKPEYQLPPVMSLDMRGRLVADKRVVFNSGRFQHEFDAAIKLAKLLKK